MMFPFLSYTRIYLFFLANLSHLYRRSSGLWTTVGTFLERFYGLECKKKKNIKNKE